MSRKLPAAPEWSPPDRDLQAFTLRLKLITPMFGGGYETRNVDPVTPIRAAAIRGHLRFWWRALHGGQFGSAKELFLRETELWGSAEKPGSILLQTQMTSFGNSKPHSKIAPRSDPKQGPREGFFLFPFQKSEKEKEGIPEASAQENVRFQLVVWFPSIFEDEVRNTLRAWISLGGVGARTRRGCGALTVEDTPEKWLPPKQDSDRQKWFRNLLTPTESSHTTFLAGGSLVWGNPDSDPKRIWSELGRFWAAFRKGHVGTHNYSPMTGSKWADYRNLTRWKRESSQANLPLAKPYLGLPIIYQNFKNGKFAGTIEAGVSGRMASPVILKPMALADGTLCPLVVVLHAPKPERIKIDGTDVSLQNLSNDPVLKDLGAKDPLEAVIKAAEKSWKTKGFTLEALP